MYQCSWWLGNTSNLNYRFHLLKFVSKLLIPVYFIQLKLAAVCKACTSSVQHSVNLQSLLASLVKVALWLPYFSGQADFYLGHHIGPSPKQRERKKVAYFVKEDNFMWTAKTTKSVKDQNNTFQTYEKLSYECQIWSVPEYNNIASYTWIQVWLISDSSNNNQTSQTTFKLKGACCNFISSNKCVVQ